MKKYGLMLSLLSWSFCFAEVIYVNTPSEPMTSEQLYIDLMKRAVANTIYEDPDYLCFQANPTGPYDPSAREVGRSWPSVAHTMIGVKRLNNIQFCMEDILKNNIEGDVIETGVWRGGATILMRAILKAYGVTDRLVWVADSFEGLPPPNPEKHPSDAGLFLNQYTFLAVSVEQVKKNFEKYGLLDQQVVFLKGFFEHTLSKAPINKLAILRLDGDL
jgi:O-methyltransferase